MSVPTEAATAYVPDVSQRPMRDRKPRVFAIGDETLIVRVRESARAKTARIIVGPRRPLEVIVPRGISDAKVDEFLEEKRIWIERKVTSARAIAARPHQLGLEQAGVVWLGGEKLPIERRQGLATAAKRDGVVVVGGSTGDAAPALVRWYRREARRRIREVAEREAQKLGLSFRSIAIRDQRTRWGSCSSKGNLSFSWRLMVAPPEVLEYVVIHELCHLREPHHSKPFWRLLEAARPGWQEQARWLREHGQELHDYDPAAVLRA